ncbi:ADP-ribose diphosphatase [Gallaecimonas xiamenensis]|uniref:ADP-ribose pyrophosphatase n=1 Tax=Gallaecimonas xiamenensis 3-C-1 TaxID=745411 RepID=K2J5E0_9GAMM|nr:ADP-ribose diphosphatase [Gallaecimonas xiamenensis]EKE70258.1 ADP-ribose pyrophosphatase NudF [Gallaecimonas xiamenensis 3-C-1]
MKENFSASDVEIKEKTPLYQGFFKMVRFVLRHRKFDGGWSPWLTREIFERGHAAVALPYDPKTDQVVLLRQFRVGALATSPDPWLYELVAGIIEQGESPQEVAVRETAEEAGLAVGRVLPVLNYLASPGGTTERLHIYAVEVDATQASGIHGLDEEGEDIAVYPVSRDQALAMLAAGQIDNAATVIGLQWLALNHEVLRHQWQ